MVKKMIIIEGPAGSGKSTIARFLAEKFNYPLVNPSLINRRPTLDEAPLLSSINDYGKMALALTKLAAGNKVVVLDRFAISEMVYGHLRLDPTSDTFAVGSHLHNLTELLKDRVIEEWNHLSVYSASSLRRRRVGTPHIFKVLWVIYTPSIDTIAHRRWMAGRDFAWSPVQEARLYSHVARAFLNLKSVKHDCLWETSPNLLTDGEFPEAIGRWIDEDID